MKKQASSTKKTAATPLSVAAASEDKDWSDYYMTMPTLTMGTKSWRSLP